MSQRRWSRAALILAPLLALAACDQISAIWQRVSGQTEEAVEGPVPLDEVPLEARAISGAVQAQTDMAALLTPEPVLVAPGEILVGAQVERRLGDVAQAMGLASGLVRSLRAEGMGALNTLPQNVMAQVRERAEQEASADARVAARDVLTRLGVAGEIEAAPGGVVKVDLNLNDGVSPTALHAAQAGEAAVAEAAEAPDAVEYNAAERCPIIVTARQLEADLGLATRCAIQRLQASRRFEYVEPNFIADAGFSLPPRRQPEPAPSPAPSQPPASSPSLPDTPETPAPVEPAPMPEATQAGGIPNDPLLSLQWNYRPRGAGTGHSLGGAGFETYWEAAQIGSREVTVAVIDTGIDLTHPEIHASGNVATGIDLITNPERSGDGDGIDADAQDAGDRCGATAENSYHGTHVAGTIGAAATNDRVGVAGGAWNVTVVPVRVLGRCGGELADIVSGIRWAAGVAPAIGPGGQSIVNQHPADIINMSLSIQAACPSSMQAAINAATARGSVVVVAAGNKADDAARFAPANCNNVVVVAAEDARGGMAFYSNFGAPVDILAPGGDVFQDSDGDGRPDGVLSTRTTQAGCYDPLNQSATARCYYSYLQGTSMAAPHVSAALALLAAETGLRGRDLEDALFTRAISPLPRDFGQIECARVRNATPISAGSSQCARPSGLGVLDLTRAAATIAAVPPPPG